MNLFLRTILSLILSLLAGCYEFPSKPDTTTLPKTDQLVSPVILTVPASALPTSEEHESETRFPISSEKTEETRSPTSVEKTVSAPVQTFLRQPEISTARERAPLAVNSVKTRANETSTALLFDYKSYTPPKQDGQAKTDKKTGKPKINKIVQPVASKFEKKKREAKSKKEPMASKSKENKSKVSKVTQPVTPKPEEKKTEVTPKKETVTSPSEQKKSDLITQVTYPGCQNEQTDLWCRIRLGYKFQVEDNAAIQEAIAYFAEAQTFFDKVVNRARPYLYYVVREVEAQDLPLELALLPVIESAYHTTAISQKAAAGLWQFIPSTAEQFGLTQNEWYDARYDVVASTRAALSFLKKLHKKFNGDWFLALAAYNWGQGNVTKAIEKNAAEGKPTDYWSLDLPTETRQYVPRLIAIAEIIAHPRDYGINLKSIASHPYFKQIEIDQPISLEVAADLADMTVDDFKYYNPTHLQETTAPAGFSRFTLPIDRADQFTKNIASKSATDLLPTPPAIEGQDSNSSTQPPVTTENTQQETQPPTQEVTMTENISEKKTITVKEVFQLPADKAKAIAEITHYYQVKNGDTLWHIAKRHNLKLSTLQALNGSEGRHLKVGQKIKLGESAPSPEVKKVKAFLIPKQRPTTTQQHRVQKKETLWHLAKSYKTTVPLLRALNNLQGQSLTVGAVLEIPMPEVESIAENKEGQVQDVAVEEKPVIEVPIASTAEEVTEESAKKKIIHTVKSGESLWLIARYYRVAIDELAEWNSLQKHDSLQSGQKLTIWQDG